LLNKKMFFIKGRYMDASLLAVGRTSAESVGGGPASSKCTAQKNTMPFSIESVDNPRLTATVSEKATDNIITDNTQTDFNTQASRSINNKLGKKTALQEANGNVDKEKAKTKDPTVRTFPNGNPPRNAPAQKSSTADTALGNVIAIGIDNSCQRTKTAKALTNPAQLTNKVSISEGLIVADKSLATNEEAVSTKGFISQDSSTGRFPAHATLRGSASGLYSRFGGVGSLRNTNAYTASTQLLTSMDALAVAENLTKSKQNLHGQASNPSVTTGSAGRKTPILDFSFPTVQGKTPSNEQKTSTDTGKTTFVDGKQTEVTGNGASDGKTIAELLDGSKKESSDKQAGNFSSQNGQAHFQKLNVSELQIGSGQTQARASSTSHNSSTTNFVPMFSPNNSQNIIAEQPSLPNQVINTANPQGQTIQNGVFGNIGDQIIDSIRASLQQADNNITVRLNPPELGNVLVKLQEQESEITGLLQVSKAEIKYEIEQELPQIIRALTDNGVQIKRLDVQLADQHEPDVGRNPNGEELESDSYQHHRFAEGNNPENNNDKELLTNISENSYQDHPEPQFDPSRQTGESINMLI